MAPAPVRTRRPAPPWAASTRRRRCWRRWWRPASRVEERLPAPAWQRHHQRAQHHQPAVGRHGRDARARHLPGSGATGHHHRQSRRRLRVLGRQEQLHPAPARGGEVVRAIRPPTTSCSVRGHAWNENVSTWPQFEPVKRVIKVDDLTVRFESDAPYPLIALKMTTWNQRLGQLPPAPLPGEVAHRPQPAEEVAKEEGFDTWWEALYAHWWAPLTDVDKRLQPWVLTETTAQGVRAQPLLLEGGHRRQPTPLHRAWSPLSSTRRCTSSG